MWRDRQHYASPITIPCKQQFSHVPSHLVWHMQTYRASSPSEALTPWIHHKQNFSTYLSPSNQHMNNITTILRKLFKHVCRVYSALCLWPVGIRGTSLPNGATDIGAGIPLRWPVSLSLVSWISLQNRVSSFLEVAVRGWRSKVLRITKYRFRTDLKWYRYALHNDVSANDWPHIRGWSIL